MILLHRQSNSTSMIITKKCIKSNFSGVWFEAFVRRFRRMRSLNSTLSRPSMHTQELILAADRLRKPERIKLSWQENLIPWYTKPDVQEKKNSQSQFICTAHKTCEEPRRTSLCRNKELWSECAVTFRVPVKLAGVWKHKVSAERRVCLFVCSFHVPPRWRLKKGSCQVIGRPSENSCPPPPPQDSCSVLLLCVCVCVSLQYSNCRTNKWRFFSLMLHFDDAKNHPRKKKTCSTNKLNSFSKERLKRLLSSWVSEWLHHGG